LLVVGELEAAAGLFVALVGLEAAAEAFNGLMVEDETVDK
jgi:hypothetical protein